MAKKTIKQAIDFIEMSNQYSKVLTNISEKKRLQERSDAIKNKWPYSHSEQKQLAARNKLEYAANKVKSQLSKKLNPYNETVEDINNEFALTGEDKAYVLDANGNKKYTPENEKKRLDKIRELQKGEIEFEPHMATQVPDDLNEVIVDAFRGFVLPEDFELKEPEGEAVSSNGVEKLEPTES